MSKNSILDYFHENVNDHGARTGALVKRDGAYQEVTWKEMGDAAKKVSRALIAAGIEPGDRVSIISNTCLEWVTTDMGILGAGAVTVPIYPSNLPDECAYIVENSEARLVFAEDAEQSRKFIEEKKRVTLLVQVVQLTGEVPSGTDGWVIGYDDFLAKGNCGDDELEKRRATLNKDSILTLIYTAGTTGRPKGVVLTHDCMMYEADVVSGIKLVQESDVQLFFLPLAHSFAKVLEITWLSTRHVMAFAENMTTIKENLGEVRPTLMCGVPRIFEKFYAAVVQKGTAAGGLKASLFNSALALSQKNGEAEMEGRSVGLTDALAFGLLKKIIFSKVGAGLQSILGGRMRLMVSGGAPLSKKIAWFFRDAGLTIVEGYGLTETSAATFVNRPENNHIGTVGQPMSDTEVRIADDGEILIKGRGVMREYWKNPEATSEALGNGWFHTGDIGEIDKNGFLRITDRKKDIIVTAGGKNVAPQNIENLLKTNKLISQVVVHGDQRKFLSALITLDPDALRTFAQEKNLGDGSYAELTQNPMVFKTLEDTIQTFNSELASYETIKKFKILEHDFSVETGELTPKLSVKRKVINDKYGKIFDGFYAD